MTTHKNDSVDKHVILKKSLHPKNVYRQLPGRLDYVHYVADLLAVKLSCSMLLDIGTGADGIYSLLACKVYEWQCVVSDIDPQSLANVAAIIDKNSSLKGRGYR
ncbi:MAG: RlmF-related methyltransferase [Gammaproteobacteria bacterium]|nr:RlmF-related methyltransferase [Gammaproteobacteria bacterium]